MVNKNIYRRYNQFSIIIFNCFSRLKIRSLKLNFLLYITNIIFFLNNIMTIDIIFDYKRNFIGLHSVIYFLNPLFYFEVLNNLMISDYSTSSNLSSISQSNLMEPSKYEKDQISLLFNKYLNVKVHEPGYFDSYLIFRALFLVLITVSFMINMINFNHSIINFFRNILSFIIFLIFQPFIQILLILYNRPFFSQLSDVRNNLNINNIFDLIILIIFNSFSFIYYDFFIYSFGLNHVEYFDHQNYYNLEWFLMIINSIIIIIRYNIRFSIFFQLLWSITFCNIFYIKSLYYIYTIKKSKNVTFFYFLDLLSFSFFIIRFISLFLINKLNELKIFKRFEIIEICFLTLCLFSFFNSRKKITTLSFFIKNLEKKSPNCYLQIKQYFNPINEFFFEQPINVKITEKVKEKLLKEYEYDIKYYFCSNQQDYNIISGGNEKLKNALNCDNNAKKKGAISFSANTSAGDFKNYTYIFSLLYNILEEIKSRSKSINDQFCIYNRENILFYKALLHFIKDGKTFRSRFIIFKFLYNEKNTISFQLNAIINFLQIYFQNFEKRVDDSSLMYIIIFQQINSYYYKLLDAFYEILKGFNNNSKTEIIYNLDKQSDVIGNSRNQINELITKYNDVLKNFQPEKEKYILIEDLIFNHTIDKNFEFFDFNYLDSLVDKNNFFLLSIENQDLIMKKVPLLYDIKTSNSGIKYYDKNFNMIFPKLISKDLFKKIKKNILLTQSFKLDSIIETSENLILGIKLSFTRLPTIDGNLFISCKLEEKDPLEENNYVLMDSNGYIYRFGLFFREYFGFSRLNKKPNIFKLLGCENFEIEKNKSENLEIITNNMIKNCKQYIGRYVDTLKQEEKVEVIKKLGIIFGDHHLIEVSIKIENSYLSNKSELFIVQIVFPIFKEGLNDKKKFGETEQPLTVQAPISFSNSASSVISFKEMKENGDKWNITNRKEKNVNKKVDVFQKLSFLYNLFLIFIAIFLCIYVKIRSNNFYKERLKYESIRELNAEVISQAFFVLNVVRIKGSTNYKSLDIEYQNNIQGIGNFTVLNYLDELFRSSSNYTFTIFRKVKNLYTKLKHGNYFFKKIDPKLYRFYTESGTFEYYNYINSFDTQLNNYYIISKIDGFYVDYNLFEFSETQVIENSESESEIKLKTMIKNGYVYLNIFNEVNYYDKMNFLKYFKSFKIFIFCGFIIFFFCNLLSILFLYISIKISINEIWKLVNNIMKITIKEKKYLENKITITKKIIYNEMKVSSGLKTLKKTSKNDSKKNNNEYLIDTEDTYLLTPNQTKQKIKYNFRVENKVLRILFGLGMIFGIYIVLSFPIMIDYLNKIDIKRQTSENSDDLQDNIFKYYLLIRSIIVLNYSYSQQIYDEIIQVNDYIYGNYSSLRNFIYKDSNKSTYEYGILINSNQGCEILTKEESYSEYLKKICYYEPILISQFGNLLAGYINELRTELSTYFAIEKTYENIVNIFHSRIFQFYNIVLLVYFQNYLNIIQYSYTFPSFEKVILQLSDFLITMFIIIVATEILNYILSAIFILGKLTSTVKNYEMMHKFFLNEEKTKQT